MVNYQSFLNFFFIKTSLHPKCRLFIESEAHVMAEPEFIVKKKKITVLVLEVRTFLLFNSAYVLSNPDSNRTSIFRMLIQEWVLEKCKLLQRFSLVRVRIYVLLKDIQTKPYLPFVLFL